jgi:RNA polymerase sigma factor (sigma-70 family)
MVGQQLEVARVDAARAGDQRALDELIAEYLPLVYNIVGRALAQRDDVDDVVQNTMLRVVRGLPGLRDPERFRSWLVAVTMNQVREHRRSWSTATSPLDEIAEPADPGADFVDLTLTRLGLSGQRREVAQATCWLDPDDRQLLALWWLEEGGHLTRAEVVGALELNAHHVTVRLARMKGQLEAARLVVRALAARPRCPRLAAVASGWRGQATSVWRKRFARHIRECEYCHSEATALIPAERLLAGLALTPLPIGYTAYILGGMHGALSGTSALPAISTTPTHPPIAAPSQTSQLPHAPHAPQLPETGRIPKRGHGSGKHGRHGSHSHWTAHLASKPLLAAVAVTAVVGGALLTVYAIAPGTRTTASQSHSQAPGTAPVPASSVSASPSTAPSAAPTSAQPAPTASKASAAKTSARATSTSTTSGSGSGSGTNTQQSAVDQVLTLINQARAGANLPAYTITSGLTTSATRHNQTMAGGCGLSHQCPGEASLGDRETAAGVQWTSAGENIGDGGPVSNTSSAVAQMAVGLTQDMLNEKPPNDGHRQNILSSSFHHIGIAVYRDGSGTVWMTQDFSN